MTEAAAGLTWAVDVAGDDDGVGDGVGEALDDAVGVTLGVAAVDRGCAGCDDADSVGREGPVAEGLASGLPVGAAPGSGS